MRSGSFLVYARHAIALGLGAFLLYVGAAMQSAALNPAQELFNLLLGLAIAVAGVWSVAALGSTRTAAFVALLVAGLGPVSVFFGWMATGAEASLLGSILWANLLGGILGGATAAWVAVKGPGGTGRKEGARVARV